MENADSNAERYDQAMFLFSQEAYDQASELLEQVLSEEPTHVDALVALSIDRKSTRLNSSHSQQSRMPSSA